jgi:peroxiredoxin
VKRHAVAVLVGLVLAPLATPAHADETPWLGIGIEVGRAGVRVTEVIPRTPAEYVGLQAGDEIASIDGHAVIRPEQLIAEVGRHAVGSSIALAVRRGKRVLRLKTTLTARLDPEELLAARLLAGPAPPRGRERAGGGPTRLARRAGKVVLIEFMSTTCAPCRTTYAELDRLDAHKDIVVLGVATESPGKLAEYAKHEGIGFALLHDAGEVARRAYFTSATPTFVVVDARGVVRHAGIGAGVGLDRAIFAARAAVRERSRD